MGNHVGTGIRRNSTAQAGKVANLILAGVGRAGTTSLFWYLSQHPDVCVSSAKEARFFNPLSDVDERASGELPPLEAYEAFFEDCSSERYRMEATPGYFHGGPPLIRGLKEVLPDARILVMLRNPITRIWSTYRYAQARLLLPSKLTFEDYLERCEQVDREKRLRPRSDQAYWEVRASRYAEFIEPWFEVFGEDFQVLFFEHLSSRPREVVTDVCQWLGLDTSPVLGFDFTVENRSIRYRSRVLQRVALAANKERFFRRHHRLKLRLRDLYYRINESGRKERMSPATRERLASLFAPSNHGLALLLRRHGYRDFPPWLEGTSVGKDALAE